MRRSSVRIRPRAPAHGFWPALCPSSAQVGVSRRESRFVASADRELGPAARAAQDKHVAPRRHVPPIQRCRLATEPARQRVDRTASLPAPFERPRRCSLGREHPLGQASGQVAFELAEPFVLPALVVGEGALGGDLLEQRQLGADAGQRLAPRRLVVISHGVTTPAGASRARPAAGGRRPRPSTSGSRTCHRSASSRGSAHWSATRSSPAHVRRSVDTTSASSVVPHVRRAVVRKVHPRARRGRHRHKPGGT